MAAVEQELFEQIKKLDVNQKKQVLDFVRQISLPQGELVKDFLDRTSKIHIPVEDLEEMKQFIEEYE